MPSHNHSLNAANTGQTLAPSAATIPASATSSQTNYGVYGPTPTTTNLNPATMKNDGGSQPHSNIQPYLAFNFIISLYGVYPSPS